MRRILIVIVLALIITISSSQISLNSADERAVQHELNHDQNQLQDHSNNNDIVELSPDLKTVRDKNYDKNNNKINDKIEIDYDLKYPVFVCYYTSPSDHEISQLKTLGTEIIYKCKYVDVIEIKANSMSVLEEIAGLPAVSFIEPKPDLKPFLDTSAAAVKARESNEYSPNTAWEFGFTGRGITIAILDTGVDDGHTALEGKFVAGADFVGAAGRITTKDGSYNPDDDTGHGTALAGIALGFGGQSNEFNGVAHDARLIDVRVSLGRGGNMMEAFDWCIDNKDTDWNGNGEDEYDGIDVVSISMGGSDDSDGSGPVSNVLNQMVDAGIVVVTAIGNDGPNNQGVGDVASTDKVITVGNLNNHETIDRKDDDIHSTSTRGPRSDDGDDDQYDELKPDVVAPGTDITAPDFNIVGQNGNGYSTNTGSSYSCPHVSGICALMLEANYKLRPKDIKKILHTTAEAIGTPDEPELSSKYNYAYGYGSVDAYEAVKMAKGYQVINHAPEIISLIASPKFVRPNEQSTINTTADDQDGDMLTYIYQASGGEITGTGPQVTWTAPDEFGDYEISVEVDDGLDKSALASVIIRVEDDPGNHAPIIHDIKAEPTVVEPGESSSITVTATDPDGDELFYEYDATGGSLIGTGAKVVWTAPESNGKYTLSILVSDGVLDSDLEKVVLTVEGGTDNRPPEIESFTASERSIFVGDNTQLNVKAIDPDQDKLDYLYIATGGELKGTGPNINWTAPAKPGGYEIEVTVRDSRGLTDSQDILIEVLQKNSPPEILEMNAEPETLDNDGTVEVLFSVKVTDPNGLEDIDKVTLDLTLLFGNENQKMYDNGKHGDHTSGDGVYSYSYLIPQGISDGVKRLPVIVEDNSEEVAAIYITININEASEEDSGDEFFGLEEYLPLPGFGSELTALAIIFIFIIFITDRNKYIRNRKKN